MKLINYVLLLGAMFLNAYVFMALFNWFAVPTLEISKINYAGAFGLSLFVGFIKSKITDADIERGEHETDDVKELAKVVALILVSLVTLGVGAIVQLAM